MEYSKLLSWEVFNFEAITHAVAEFDENNVIMFKGYNDSGKTTMCLALTVLLFNIKASKQVAFIKDGTDYFRIVAKFSDGVVILRDKYINGQSLYEMYQGDKLVYTTKNGNSLTRVVGVPEPIEKYLGLITFGNECLNSRSCTEKQFLAQTTGSENYKALNVILKSEELAVASSMLNDDKNKCLQDINATDSRLQSTKELLGVGTELTEQLISVLEELDKSTDLDEEREQLVKNIINTEVGIKDIVIPPEVQTIEYSQLNDLSKVVGVLDSLQAIPCLPEVDMIDSLQLDLLSKADYTYKALSGIPDLPQISSIDVSRLDDLSRVQKLVSDSIELEREENSLGYRLQEIEQEISSCISELESLGKRFVKCPNCGTVYDTETGHTD